MKVFHLSLFLLNFGHSFAQLPVIYAEGGDGKNIDWEAVKKQYEEDAEEGDLPFFYNDCTIEFNVTKASSELSPQGQKNYSVQNLNDEDPTTAWVPESKHNGIGEYFEIASNGLNGIYNGYQANPKLWRNNSRVKKLKVYKDNGPLCYLILKDEMGGQHFELPGYDGYSENPKHRFRFEIVEVYKGEKYKNVAISEIEWSGCCFAGNTQIKSGQEIISISALETGQKINALDAEKNQLFETEVLKISRQKHIGLITVQTTTKTITLTKNHPLYVRGYGFISIERLREESGAKNYSDLLNQTEVLVWDEELMKQIYEPIVQIKKEEKLVDAYSIRSLQHGNVYIANGFITKTY